MAEITVSDETDGTYTVQSHAAKVASALDDFDKALRVTALLIRCEFGDPDACGELDRLGYDPPSVELDERPVPR